MIGCQAIGEYRVMLGAALTVGVTPVEVKEIVYQAVPTSAWPRPLTSCTSPTTSSPSAASSCRFLGSPRPQPRPGREGPRGAEADRRRHRVDTLDASAPDDEQHLQRWLSANFFGDHLTRAGIDVPTRELLTFAMLVRSAAASRNSPGTSPRTSMSATTATRLLNVLTQLIPYIGYRAPSRGCAC